MRSKTGFGRILGCWLPGDATPSSRSVLLVLLIPAGALSGTLWWFISKDAHPLAKRHVLTGAASAAYAAPAEASSQLISLPPGSEVMPLETRGNWFYCEVPTEGDTILRGWVRSSLLQPLWPYPAPPRG